MNKIAIVCLITLASFRLASAQVSGNAGAYGRDGIDPARAEAAKRQIVSVPAQGNDTSTLIEAAVLMNVKADEYVAVFAVSVEGATPEVSVREMDATLAKFSGELDKVGVLPADRTVDFIAQSRVYGFEKSDDKPGDADGPVTLVETLSGFETRKNVSIRFRDIGKVEALVAAAARADIYDLVKVDYIVLNSAQIQERLQLQTMNIIRQKAARYGATLGLKLGNPTQIVADVPSVYFPTGQYSSYTAADTEKATVSYNRNRTTIISARKTTSTYFSPLGGDGFDAVINPVVTEPVVQFTTYIKVRYAPPKK